MACASAEALKWNREKTLILIEMVEARECLWNVQLEDYRNKIKRQNAIEDIANAMKMTHEDIRQKIHRLRSQYTNERSKMKKKKSGSGSAELYKTKWEYFQALDFMFQHSSVGSDNVDSLVSKTFYHKKNFILQKN